MAFPSPSTDYVEKHLDLNEYLIRNKETTFFMRVKGDSMIGAGIHDNDLLIVDKSLIAKSGSIIVAVIDAGFVVKRFVKEEARLLLVSENVEYEPIEITPDLGFEIWGVVTNVVHKV
ncbi:MAG: translesion error-prone DNA polymerase V autoproteolytic subunit [Candidatus Obscuribacterales bacterium]|nr:translesion error-prone DNA polymerase V autoproteolytic subunit [Candidatus Obscuribacterales bacterium]